MMYGDAKNPATQFAPIVWIFTVCLIVMRNGRYVHFRM